MKTAVDIFIAYAHNDLHFKDELKKFLRPLLNTGRAQVWDDYDIEAGHDWEVEIKKRLYGADIILLLVSPDSLASDYFYGKEVAVSLERHERGEARVVPIILRPCAWNMTPLSKIEALPAKGKAITQWASQDEAFTDIAQSIGEITTGIIEKLAKLQVEERDRRQYVAATQAADHLRDQHRWAEAQAAYMDAIDLFKPGFEPQKEELERDLADCKQQHDQETATTAFQQRRTTFENKLKQAGQLFNVANWVEARSAWQELLTLHEADFSVSLASINAKIDRCSSEIEQQTKFDTLVKRANQFIQRKAWSKAAATAYEALVIHPNHPEALEIKQLAESSITQSHPQLLPNTKIRKYLFGAGIIVIAAIILIKLIPFVASLITPGAGKIDRELMLFEEARTIPELQNYILQYPNSSYITSAQTKLKEQETVFYTFLNNAQRAMNDGDFRSARVNLHNALNIWPSNKEAQQLMDKAGNN